VPSGEPIKARGGWPVRLGDVLPDVLNRSGARGAWTESRVRKAWDKAVGPEIAARTRVARLRGRTLEVWAENESWATQLRYLSSVVVTRLNEVLGAETVSEIQVRRGRSKSR